MLRAQQRRWGATDDEVNRTLPGDDLISPADLTATRAITIHATAAKVWPWIAQLGQGRAASTVTGMTASAVPFRVYLGRDLGLVALGGD